MKISARSAATLLRFVEKKSTLSDRDDRDLKSAVDDLKLGRIFSRQSKRRSGRPRQGAVLVRQERLDELPDWITVADCARILGVNYTTIRRWATDDPGIPLERRQSGRLSFRRRDLIDYLAVTGRYRSRLS